MQDNIYEIEGSGIICCILGVLHPALAMFDIKGCPASGSLLAIVFDPFVRLYHHLLDPHLCLIISYADDLAMGLRDLFSHLALLVPALQLMGAAASLWIHPGKAVIVWLGSLSLDAVRPRIAAEVGYFASAKVSLSGALLGVTLGGNGRALSWLKPAAKFWETIAPLKQVRGGFCK
ncbi:unnamed protein product, partial [Prorocentrum cordatum]